MLSNYIGQQVNTVKATLAMSAVYFAARLSFFSPGLKTLLIIGPLAKNSAIELALRDFFCFCR